MLLLLGGLFLGLGLGIWIASRQNKKIINNQKDYILELTKEYDKIVSIYEREHKKQSKKKV